MLRGEIAWVVPNAANARSKRNKNSFRSKKVLPPPSAHIFDTDWHFWHRFQMIQSSQMCWLLAADGRCHRLQSMYSMIRSSAAWDVVEKAPAMGDSYSWFYVVVPVNRVVLTPHHQPLERTWFYVPAITVVIIEMNTVAQVFDYAATTLWNDSFVIASRSPLVAMVYLETIYTLYTFHIVYAHLFDAHFIHKLLV